MTIGDKNYTEQFILGQLYMQALKAQGYTVNINQNIGPTDVTLQALKSGALSMYPEYLYVLNSNVAHSHSGHRQRAGGLRRGAEVRHRARPGAAQHDAVLGHVRDRGHPGLRGRPSAAHVA